MLGPLKEAFALFQNCKPFDQTFPLLGFFFTIVLKCISFVKQYVNENIIWNYGKISLCF